MQQNLGVELSTDRFSKLQPDDSREVDVGELRNYQAQTDMAILVSSLINISVRAPFFLAKNEFLPVLTRIEINRRIIVSLESS